MSNKRNFVYLNVNPCKMCMPMGGSLALKGIENCMILIHGSQGCSTYIRRHIAAHYNEPVDIASSSLNEKGTVYGGAKNLKHGIKNIMKLYKPKVIGVLTTCLAETIGEDIGRIINEFKERHDINDVDIIPIPTPGYGASQHQGYYFAIRQVVKYYVQEKIPNKRINIISAHMTPADIRELKRILKLFEISEYTLIPDISQTLDAPFLKEYYKIPKGGTKPEDIKLMGGAVATIELGQMISDEHSPGVWLKEHYDVPLYKCPIPIGLKNTDQLINTISEITGKPIPDELKIERGRMIDAMIDSHKYNGEGRAAIFGNPEIIYSVSRLCIENGIKPEIISTGTKVNTLTKYMRKDLKKYDYESIVLDDTDFETIQSYCKDKDVNILIGNSDGKFIMEKESIPLVRIGFPIHDQMGAQRKLYIGYEGSMRFLDDITNTLLDAKHHSYRSNMYNNYYEKEEKEGEVNVGMQ